MNDVYLGKPANGLIWMLSNGIDFRNPPTEKCFCNRNGQKYLKSNAYKHKMSHEKDSPKSWLLTEYGSVTNYRVTEMGDEDIFTWETPLGCHTGRRRHNHFHEYPVKTIEDVDGWIHVYSNMSFSINQDRLIDKNLEEIKRISLNWSPVQQLIQFDMGLENFFFFLVDAPDKMQELLDVMQERCVERLNLGMSPGSVLPSSSHGEHDCRTIP